MDKHVPKLISKTLKSLMIAISILAINISLAKSQDIIISPEGREQMQRAVKVANAETSRVRKGLIIAAQNDPKKIIQDIYGHYPANEADDSWHKADTRWMDNSGDFELLPLSQEFRHYVDKWKARGIYMSCIDVNAMVNAQDWVFNKYRIKNTRTSENSRTIYVQIDQDPNLTVVYDFILDKNKWYIDEITDFVFDKEFKNIYSTQVKDSHKKGLCRE